MLKFHIKITDNETGRIIEDADIACIFGGIGFEDSTAQIALAHEASTLSVAKALIAANKVIEKVVNECGADVKAVCEILMKGSSPL